MTSPHPPSPTRMRALAPQATGLAWRLPPGPFNAITDVAGVRVGHATLIHGTGPLVPGQGPVRTGVTVVLPHAGNLFRQKVPAAAHTINGYGKAAGFEQVRELGTLEAPIALTNTLNVGRVLDALVTHAIQQSPEIGVRASSVNIVVGETNDSYLNDLQGRHVGPEDVFAALAGASGGPQPEGALGAGTGTVCFGWKGGIGTASRVLSPAVGGYTLGALVQSNFGDPQDLLVLGVPVGRKLTPSGQAAPQPGQGGSVMVVLATDAPLGAMQLRRLCVRAAAGLARTGSHFSPGSGDFVIAFSVASAPVPVDEVPLLNDLFRAVVESVEEAVLDSLTCATDMQGRDDHFVPALPLVELAHWVS